MSNTINTLNPEPFPSTSPEREASSTSTVFEIKNSSSRSSSLSEREIQILSHTESDGFVPSYFSSDPSFSELELENTTDNPRSHCIENTLCCLSVGFGVGSVATIVLIIGKVLLTHENVLAILAI